MLNSSLAFFAKEALPLISLSSLSHTNTLTHSLSHVLSLDIFLKRVLSLRSAHGTYYHLSVYVALQFLVLSGPSL